MTSQSGHHAAIYLDLNNMTKSVAFVLISNITVFQTFLSIICSTASQILSPNVMINLHKDPLKETISSHLLLAVVLVSFLDPDPDGEGRVLPFFGRMVPLFTVGRNGRVAIIGLAERKMTTAEHVQKRLHIPQIK